MCDLIDGSTVRNVLEIFDVDNRMSVHVLGEIQAERIGIDYFCDTVRSKVDRIELVVFVDRGVESRMMNLYVITFLEFSLFTTLIRSFFHPGL